MVKLLEELVPVELGADKSKALLALVKGEEIDTVEELLAACTSCNACNSGAPTCVSCVGTKGITSYEEIGYEKNETKYTP